MKKKERRGDERLGKPESREGWKCGERERERSECSLTGAASLSRPRPLVPFDV